MPVYVIPVEWVVEGVLNIEAESLEDAVDIAYEGSIPLPINSGNSRGDSFRVIEEDLIDYNENLSSSDLKYFEENC